MKWITFSIVGSLLNSYVYVGSLFAAPVVGQAKVVSSEVEFVCPSYVTFSPTQSPSGWQVTQFRANFKKSRYFVTEKKLHCSYEAANAPQLFFTKSNETACPYRNASSPVVTKSASSSVSGMKLYTASQSVNYDTAKIESGNLKCYFQPDQNEGLSGLVTVAEYSSCSITSTGAICKK